MNMTISGLSGDDLLSFKPEAVILANGEYPGHDFPLCLLQKAPYVVCCDGAASTYLIHGCVPDVIIGDGDSLEPATRKRYIDRIHYIADQETNDLTKAVRFLTDKGVQSVVILGATGKREDHTLGNISLLMEYYTCFAHLAMVTDHGIFFPASGIQTFASRPGQQISIFNFGACEMHSEGLVYPVRDFTRLWEGTLNEASGTSFTIFCKGDYLVYLAYDIK